MLPSLHRRVFGALAAILLGACGTVPLEPPPSEPPLIKQTDARVGAVYLASARTARIVNPMVRIEVGKASVERFALAFSALFTQAVELPDWPPWRDVPPRVDGVMEVEGGDMRLVMDAKPNASSITVSLSFRVCLYEPLGTLIKCWNPASSQRYNRDETQCLNPRTCVGLLTESALRGAVARFLMETEDTPELKAWATRAARKGGAP